MEGIFNIETRFVMYNLMVTFEIQRKMCTTINCYVWLTRENQINREIKIR